MTATASRPPCTALCAHSPSTAESSARGAKRCSSAPLASVYVARASVAFVQSSIAPRHVTAPDWQRGETSVASPLFRLPSLSCFCSPVTPCPNALSLACHLLLLLWQGWQHQWVARAVQPRKVLRLSKTASADAVNELVQILVLVDKGERNGPLRSTVSTASPSGLFLAGQGKRSPSFLAQVIYRRLRPFAQKVSALGDDVLW